MGDSRRGTSSANIRGSSYDRRRRRAFLIERDGVPRALDGKRTRVPCHWCRKLLKSEGRSWEVDRHPTCGHDGGRYTRDNIVVACKACNGRRCNTECRFRAPLGEATQLKLAEWAAALERIKADAARLARKMKKARAAERAAVLLADVPF